MHVSSFDMRKPSLIVHSTFLMLVGNGFGADPDEVGDG